MPRRTTAPIVAVTTALVLTSVWTMQRLGGGPALLLQAGVAGAVCVLVVKRLGPQNAWWPGRTTAWWLAGLSLVAVTLATSVGYDLANSDRLGSGADSDDALVLGVHELLAGRYPYHSATYLGNPISPMPGGLLISAPFVLVGRIELLNVAALGALFAALARRLDDPARALLLSWIVIGLCPGVVHQLITGIDYVANAICMLLAIWLVDRSAGERATPSWALVGAVLALGVASSWRANFVFLLPVLVGHLAARVGRRRASGLGVALGGVLLAVTLPFYLFDPAGFSPLHTGNKLGRFDALLPHAQLLVPAATLLLACALALWPGRRLSDLMWRCAAVQTVPVFAGITLSSVERGALDVLRFGGYATFVLFFAAVAWWLDLYDPIDSGAPRSRSIEGRTASATNT